MRLTRDNVKRGCVGLSIWTPWALPRHIYPRMELPRKLSHDVLVRRSDFINRNTRTISSWVWANTIYVRIYNMSINKPQTYSYIWEKWQRIRQRRWAKLSCTCHSRRNTALPTTRWLKLRGVRCVISGAIWKHPTHIRDTKPHRYCISLKTITPPTVLPFLTHQDALSIPSHRWASRRCCRASTILFVAVGWKQTCVRERVRKPVENTILVWHLLILLDGK